MAVPWAIIGGSVVSGVASYLGGSSAAKAQEKAAKKGIQAQERALNQQLAMQEPSRYLGYQAAGDLASLYGYGMAPYMGYTAISDIGNRQGRVAGVRDAYNNFYAGQGAGGAAGAGAPGEAGNFARFYASPDYQFRKSEGMDAIKNLASVRGGVGGNVMREGANFASGLAAGEFNTYVSRLMQLAGFGANATSQAGQAAGQTGANVGNLYSQQGNARASGYMNAAQGVNSAIQGGLQNWAFQNYLQSGGAGSPYGFQYPFDQPGNNGPLPGNKGPLWPETWPQGTWGGNPWGGDQ